jgi:acetyl esterase
VGRDKLRPDLPEVWLGLDNSPTRTIVTFVTRAILPVIIALALNTPAIAQPCPALHVRNPDGNYIIPGVKGDIPYTGDLALDAYVQRDPGRRVSVVVIHGGAWSSGSRVAHIGQLLDVLTRAGYNWFSVDYRLGGLRRFEESLADIRAALAFVRCRARELGIDPDRLVLLGEESGAHLVALLATERVRGVIGAVLVGGFYDLTTTPGVTKDVDAALLPRASPITHVAPGMPPLLVVHGGADGEAPIDQAQRYCRAVVRAKGRCQFLEVEGASHRSENWWPNQWRYKREMVTWLRALGSSPRGAHRPHSGTTLLKDIVYSELAQLKLDAFVPRVSKSVPAVILVHGGGWEAGDKVTYVTPLFEPLARAGLAWFSIDYRLTPASTHQDQLADVRRAIQFVRAEHARFNIDPARIVLVGESASGQMVTQIATEDASLAGVISFYGVYDLPSMVTDTSSRSLLVRLFRRHVLDDDARALLRQYSPLYQAHKSMPPLLLINGTGERLWVQAQAFARRLTDLGVRHEMIALEGAPHGLENWEGQAAWTTYKRRVVEWIWQVAR